VIKVQDGCNHFCSFCIIPYARGRLRSRPPAEVLAEARAVADRGGREIVLAGICLGDFGDERGFARAGAGDPLADLVRRLGEIPGLARIRLSSLDPADVSDELIETLAAVPRACRHLHLSLQAGDDEVLRRMRRRYLSTDFRRLVETINGCIPGCALTCDVIAGFPGETEAQFAATEQLCEEVGFVKIHAFPYSPRAGTLAARWPDDVPCAEKERRVHALMALSDRLAYRFAAAHLDRELEVLVEARDRRTGLLNGLTDDYLRAEFEGEDPLRHQLVRLRPVSAGDSGVLAEVI
jgi:threonylcarbamoyladenosine tRNA methylthiotransferase MtaB